MAFFVNKKRQDRKPAIKFDNVQEEKPVVKDKEIKEEKTMDIDKVSALEEIVADKKPVKRVKKDKGLIERTESSKVILTEDNKQLLMD